MEFLIGLLFGCLVCGGVGLWFGGMRQRETAGFWLGFFFGPFGWLLTLLLPDGDVSQVGGASGSPHGSARCPTCGGTLVGQYQKCQHCASDVFWAGNVPTRSECEASAERQRQELVEAERQRVAEFQKAQERRQAEADQERAERAAMEWEQLKQDVIRQCKVMAKWVAVMTCSAAAWTLKSTDKVLRGLSRRRCEIRARAAMIATRRLLRKVLQHIP